MSLLLKSQTELTLRNDFARREYEATQLIAGRQAF